jgi:hypothetical protein
MLLGFARVFALPHSPTHPLIHPTVDVTKLPLGMISEAQLQRGQDLLAQLQTLLKVLRMMIRIDMYACSFNEEWR